MSLIEMRIGDVIAMTALVVVVLIALILAGNLQTVATGMDLGVQGNATRTTLFNNTFTALTLASVGIIVAAAVGILALVIGALGGATGAPV